MVDLLEFVFRKVDDVSEVRGTSADVVSTAISKDSTTFTPYKIVSMSTFNNVFALPALASIAGYTVKHIIHIVSPGYESGHLAQDNSAMPVALPQVVDIVHAQ
jgi:hypothetical protein